jgi:hypothetical protein
VIRCALLAGEPGIDPGEVLTPRSRRCSDRAPCSSGALGVTRIWCVKEAVLEAEREGLRLPASAVMVAAFGSEVGNGWGSVHLARWPGGDEMHAWVCEIEGAVIAVAAAGTVADEVPGVVVRV